jgi:hypothetical protein
MPTKLISSLILQEREASRSFGYFSSHESSPGRLAILVCFVLLSLQHDHDFQQLYVYIFSNRPHLLKLQFTLTHHSSDLVKHI